MYIIHLKKDLTIEAMSKSFKALFSDEGMSLEDCFFFEHDRP